MDHIEKCKLGKMIGEIHFWIYVAPLADGEDIIAENKFESAPLAAELGEGFCSSFRRNR